ncbi:nucleoid occlusion factor SlmA [Hydrogenophaga sp. NH-16]|uniref:nucleoid occlusion factor SlmA n=1 Tax=Hydrogenophaga sp. NH-16 TaxID=2184519 RepID=UPI000FDC9E0A|nr:nucleoid occlusion factor SlmA [Hydrogenophaga sp. NH-16]
MSSSASSSTAAASTEAASEGAESTESGGRKRPKPGERRVQILQALATMLEQPGAERVTTAALAARLEVSEAALYRHFASKAQMFEGLIEFIEQSVFGLVNQLGEREPDPVLRSRKLVTLLLQFGEKNPGMARVMVGDALVYENERLQQRMNLFFDKIESALRQNLREIAVLSSATTPTVDAQADASVITAFCMGRLQRFARSGFKRPPSENLDHGLRLLLPDGRL